MAERGVTLSVFAGLFVLLAVSNFIKPFSHDPGTVFIFLGSRTSGPVEAILASLFGLYLMVYAFGIWQMRRWVLPMAYTYAGWVVLNGILFGAKNKRGPLLFAIASVIGIGVSSGAAILLARRRAQLT